MSSLFRLALRLGVPALLIIGLRKAMSKAMSEAPEQSGDKVEALAKRIEEGDASQLIVAVARIHEAFHRRAHTNHDASPEAAKSHNGEVL